MADYDAIVIGTGNNGLAAATVPRSARNELRCQLPCVLPRLCEDGTTIVC